LQTTRFFKLAHIKRDFPGLLWTLLAICFVLAMVKQPGTVFAGATTGLKTWWEVVFPSLLPFFIASEILMRLGLVHFIGVLLEPVMRPLFNVPGAGGFVMVIGFTSGFPIGSSVTAQLRRQGLCTRIEAERLMSFTNNSSPLFMLTAVAVGMFGQPELGIVIAGSHYLANIILGICLRFYKKNDPEARHCSQTVWSPLQALRGLLDHQRRAKQPLGKLLGEAVSSSITKLINIGGFIILFAVIIRLLSEAGITGFIATCLGLVLVPLGFAPDILNSLASGFFEMTIGVKTASEASAEQVQKLAAVALILGWSGLSIHAQVASMIVGTDIRMGLFVLTRLFHALLASLLTMFFFNSGRAIAISIPVLSPALNFASNPYLIIIWSLGVMFLMLFAFTLLGCVYGTILALIRSLIGIR